MDCNKIKDEDGKAGAERKLLERNYASLMAQKMCPELEGLSQLLAIIDIYICGENRTIGEADWYGILGVIPYALCRTVSDMEIDMHITLSDIEIDTHITLCRTV